MVFVGNVQQSPIASHLKGLYPSLTYWIGLPSVDLASCVFWSGFLFITLKIHADVMENTKKLLPSLKSVFLSRYGTFVFTA